MILRTELASLYEAFQTNCEDRDLWLVIADAHEEQGEDHRAQAWRYLHVEGLHPYLSTTPRTYNWYKGTQAKRRQKPIDGMWCYISIDILLLLEGHEEGGPIHLVNPKWFWGWRKKEDAYLGLIDALTRYLASGDTLD